MPEIVISDITLNEATTIPQLHITTKVWRTDLGYDATLVALDKAWPI